MGKPNAGLREAIAKRLYFSHERYDEMLWTKVRNEFLLQADAIIELPEMRALLPGSDKGEGGP